jgi:tyrosyl-tRNA synthetase
MPSADIDRAELAAGIPAFELIRRVGLAASNSEARRLIKGGGGRLNDRVLEHETQPITAADLDDEGRLKLSAGRKRHILVRAT